METIYFTKCKKDGCNNLATKIGTKEFDYCLQHLKKYEIERVEELLREKKKDLECSIIDGRSVDDRGISGSTSTNYQFKALPCNFQRDANLRGSIFIAIDFSSADFERVDFSFCFFIGCDLRRTRLYNSSLRWACFNRTLLRQADINNSDCRWIQAQSVKKNDDRWRFDNICSRIAEKHATAASKYLHVIGRNDAQFFFRRFGYIANEDEKKLFEQQKFKELAEIAEKVKYKGTDSNQGKLHHDYLLREIPKTIHKPNKTDWSGAALRDSDLAYSCFDHTLAVEVVFDGSDLFEASFCNATLDRSSFLNASFSRCNLPESDNSPTINNEKIVESRFKLASMRGCILDGTNLERLFFEKTVLNNATMKGAFLEKALFFQCEMRNITADDVVGENAYFLASNLSGSSFKGSILNKARFWWDSESLPIKLPDEETLRNSWENLATDEDRANLTAINFQAAELENVIFNKSKLNGALFQAASLNEACLQETVCLGAQFAASKIDGVDFGNANLISCSFKDAGMESKPPKFNGATLEDAILSNMDLTGTSFENAKLDGANFADSKLINVKFVSTDINKKLEMQRVILSNTILNGALFENVDLTSADLSFAIIQNNFEGQRKERTSFKDCTLYMANLKGIQLPTAKLINCDLRKCNFSFAKLGRTSTSKQVVFEECSFEDSSFHAVECVNIHIEHAQDFNGIDWSDSTLKRCSITNHKEEEQDAFKAIQFDGSTIKDLTLENLCWDTVSFNFSDLDSFNCENVIFINSNFKSSKIHIKNNGKTHFLYADFSSAYLSEFEGLPYNSVFLGCNFNDTVMPDKPDPIIFVDCLFIGCSFLADPKKVENWQKALFVHCKFNKLKYYGLREASEELGIDAKERNGIIFEDFIEQLRLTTKDHVQNLEDARSVVDHLPNIANRAKRLKVLIPEKSALQRDEGYSLTRNLCREFRKDFLKQGFAELASKAYVEEMDCELKLYTLRYGTKLADKSWVKRAKMDKLFKCLLPCSVDSPFEISSFLILFFATVISYLTSHVYSIALLIVILPSVFLCRRGVRLFLAKYLYDYGENVGKMLWSALVCIIFFTILYYGFIPKVEGKRSLCSNNPKKDCLELQQNPFIPAFEKEKRIISGSLNKDNGTVITRSGTFDLKALLTCFYFSGVTFTTLGYGDIKPQGLVRYVAMMEAGLGAFLMALFVFSFTRRNALRQ